MIGRFSGDRTVLFSTHDMAEAERLAAKVLVLVRGRVAACDTVAALKAAAGVASLAEAVAVLTRTREAS